MSPNSFSICWRTWRSWIPNGHLSCAGFVLMTRGPLSPHMMVKWSGPHPNGVVQMRTEAQMSRTRCSHHPLWAGPSPRWQLGQHGLRWGGTALLLG